MPGLAKHPAPPIEAQGPPQLIERPHIAQRPCRLKLDRWYRCIQYSRAPGCLEQSGNHRVELTVKLIEPTQRHQRAMPRLPGLIAKRLNQLQIAARSGASDLEKHATT